MEQFNDDNVSADCSVFIMVTYSFMLIGLFLLYIGAILCRDTQN